MSAKILIQIAVIALQSKIITGKHYSIHAFYATTVFLNEIPLKISFFMVSTMSSSHIAVNVTFHR